MSKRKLTKLSTKYNASSQSSPSAIMAPAPASEELVKTIITNILSSEDFISLIQRHVNSALEKVARQVEVNTAEILDLNIKYDKMSKGIEDINKELDQLREFKHKSSRDTNSLEQYTRRNSLRIFGIPVTKDEDTNNIIIKLASDKLEIQLSPEDIDRSHRVGKPDSDARAIIVKFARHDTKAKVIRARRKLAGSPIVIREDLTKINHNLLKAAKDNDKVNNAWSWDGRILATKNGSSRVYPIRNESDIAKL